MTMGMGKPAADCRDDGWSLRVARLMLMTGRSCRSRCGLVLDRAWIITWLRIQFSPDLIAEASGSTGLPDPGARSCPQRVRLR